MKKRTARDVIDPLGGEEEYKKISLEMQNKKKRKYEEAFPE